MTDPASQDEPPAALDEAHGPPPNAGGSPRPHRRNRPFLGGTVSAETRRLALHWLASAPPGRRRSVGEWIDRLAERAAGCDRGQAARDEALRRRLAAHARSILAGVNALSFGCDAAQRLRALADLRAAAREIASLPPRPPDAAAAEPEYQI